MFPRLFTIGDTVTLHTYGLMMASALLVGIFLASRFARRAGLDPGMVWNLGVYMALAGLLGSKILLVLSVWRSSTGNLREFFSLNTLFAGGVWYGGLLLAITVCGFYAWRNRVSFAALGDVYSPGVAGGYALGRLGCFAAGCCWGKPLEAAWAVTFTDPYSARVVGVPLGVPLHPTQLYSSAASALIFLLLVLLWRRRRFNGEIFAAYMMLYAVARFAIEFYRGDPRGDYYFNGALSQAQTICIVLFVVAGLFGFYQWRHGAAPAHAESS